MQNTVTTTEDRRRKLTTITKVAACNFVEAYDFVVYGYYAVYIAAAFFPANSAYSSLMLSLITFGAGYLMRPAGAILLGAYMDRKGRRSGLILTLMLMAIGTVSIAITPSYAAIGIAAPLIVLAGRLLQGLSAGAEFGGVTIYLTEIATPGRRGFYCSWQAVSQQVAVMVAALFGIALTWFVPQPQILSWGWRIPLLAGFIAVPLVLWLRQSLQETEVFQHSRHVRSLREVLRILLANWKVILTGAGLAVMTNASFYLITAYTPTYAREVMHIAPGAVFAVTLLVGFSNIVWLLIGGLCSDKLGPRPLMIAVCVASIAVSYPLMLWVAATPSVIKLAALLLIYSVAFGFFYGAQLPMLADLMPAEIRTAAFSLSSVTATVIFGGFTPAICTWLIELTGDRAAPALWLSLGAAISLWASWTVPALSERAVRLRPSPAE